MPDPNSSTVGRNRRYSRDCLFVLIDYEIYNYFVPKRVQVIKKSDVDLDDFRISAMKGNLTSVKSYIEGGVPVSQVLRSGWTALMYAVSCGRWQVTEYLLEKKANPNFHKELFTPLMAACASSHENEEDLVKCVEILIDAGANVNASERHKVTPLMFACKEKRLKIVQVLLRREEINVDLQDHRGWTVSNQIFDPPTSSKLHYSASLGINVGGRQRRWSYRASPFGTR